MRLRPRAGRLPTGADVLASVDSPPMERLVRLTNKPSDNFFAEMLLKDLAPAGRRPRHHGGRRGVGGGLRPAGSAARARLVDGSGLSRGNRASPLPRGQAAHGHAQPRRVRRAFVDSLPIAGRDGTLCDPHARGPARARCRGKTGTLSNVSALSGYCERPLAATPTPSRS